MCRFSPPPTAMLIFCFPMTLDLLYHEYGKFRFHLLLSFSACCLQKKCCFEAVWYNLSCCKRWSIRIFNVQTTSVRVDAWSSGYRFLKMIHQLIWKMDSSTLLSCKKNMLHSLWGEMNAHPRILYWVKENQSQHIKLHHCSNITISKQQHILYWFKAFTASEEGQQKKSMSR